LLLLIAFKIEIQSGDKWIPVAVKEQMPAKPCGNTENTLVFDKTAATVSG
jgi:ribosomal protein S19